MATKHSHKPNFGRHVDDCLRCQELKDGAEPVRWNTPRQGLSTAEIRAHDCRRSNCGPVCTFGDW
ncbi:hypothetical protein AB0O20_06510 [Streptomyces kronopolitis]|uniref:hypothetical protein n=1 Tax=Streptomyces kronopolitis TaxID=1612435 RepID=UPI003416DB3F